MASSLSTASLSFAPQSSRGSSSGGRSSTSFMPQLSSQRFRVCCQARSLQAAKPETLQKVINIVAKQLATTEDKVTPDSKLADLGADSLDQVEIVMALEEEFKTGIEDRGAESIVTIQDAANLIENAAASAPV